MKTFKWINVLFVFLILSCSSDNDSENNANNNTATGNNNALQNFTTPLCGGISGPTAAYWANAHGVKIPITDVPIITNPGQQFIHSQYPGLGFTMPQGYAAAESIIGLGVNMFRNDNAVLWRYVPGLSTSGQVPILDIVASEINQLFSFYGHTGNFEVVCSNNISQPQGNLNIRLSSRLLRFGNITALVLVQTYYETSLNATFASVSIASAPSAEYDNLILNVFFPMHWQLLVGKEKLPDTDLDGTPDGEDKFPFDPNRQ